MNFLRGCERQYELFVDAIKNDDQLQFTEYYMERKRAVWSKGLVNRELLSRLCVLYRKPEFLKLIHDMDQNSLNTHGCLGNGLKLVDLARALGDYDCVKVIQDSFETKETENDAGTSISHISYKLYIECIKMASRPNGPKFPELSADTICTLAERGFDINEAGHEGKTPLHEAVANKVDPIVFTALIENGADVDKMDNFGTSPFRSLLSKLRYFNRQQLVRIVKLFIKGNPSQHLYSDLITKTLHSDNNFCAKSATEIDALELYKGTDSVKEKYREKVEKRLVTPIMLKSGFKLGNSQDLRETMYHPDLVMVLQQILCNPQPLSHLCRNVLRRYFPGTSIMKLCDSLTIPKSTRAFILYEETW